MKKVNVKAIAVTGVLTAAAFLLTFVFRFKVSFLTFDFKDTLIAITSLTYGFPYGVASAFLVALIELLTVSETGIYGFLMNFLASGTFALVCGLIYKQKRTFKGAILSLVLAAISVNIVMITANIFITPLYMGVDTDAVISLILPLLLPFNISKTVINSAATLLLYKPITSALKRYNILSGEPSSKTSLKSVIIATISVLIIVLTVLYITLKLNGVFEIF